MAFPTPEERDAILTITESGGYKVLSKLFLLHVTALEADIIKTLVSSKADEEKLTYKKLRAEGARKLLESVEAFIVRLKQPAAKGQPPA